MRACALALLLCACGDDSGGGPTHTPVLALGGYAGTFDDGAAGMLHGLIGVVASSDGRITMHLQNQELPFLEANVGTTLFQGMNTYQPIVAYGGAALITNATVTVENGSVHGTVTTHPQGDPSPDRTITVDG